MSSSIDIKKQQIITLAIGMTLYLLNILPTAAAATNLIIFNLWVLLTPKFGTWYTF